MSDAIVRHSPARLKVFIPLGLGVLAATCVMLAIGPWPVGVFQDDGVYVVLAKALATGEGYRFIQMPGAPNATHYPPGYPLLLALLWKLSPSFPANVTLFKFANAVLVGVTAVLSWRLATGRAGLGSFGGGLAAGLFTACTPIVLLSVMVLSEPMFMAALVPTILLAERAGESERWQDAVLAGVAVGLLSLIRTLGILVVPALVLVMLARKRWRLAALVAAAAVTVMLPWQLWVSAHTSEVPPIFLGKYGSYVGWLTDAVRTEGPAWVARVARKNLGQLAFETWTHTGTVLLPIGVRILATVLVATLAIAGFASAFRRVPVLALFLLAYLGIVIVWPFAPARFLWGVWPLIGLVLALGAQRLAPSARGARPLRKASASTLREASARPLALAPVAATTLLVLGYLRFNYQAQREGWWTQVQGSVAMRARPMAEWVNRNTSPDAVLATDDDLLIYLYTGRRTIPNAAFTAQEHLDKQTEAFAAAQLRTILDTYEVDYVLAGTEYANLAVRRLSSTNPPQLQMVREVGQGAVFVPVRTP